MTKRNKLNVCSKTSHEQSESEDDEEGETTPGSFQLVNLHFRGCAAGETQNDDEGQPSEVQQRNIDICGVGVAEYLKPSALNAESSISFDGAITKYANTEESMNQPSGWKTPQPRRHLS